VRWTPPPAEKAQLLEEALQPGVTVASIADKHGISRGLFYQWMAKARAGLLPGVTLNGLPTPRFVPVRLEQKDAPAAPGPSKPSLARISAGTIEIVLGNGRVLKAREGIDPAVLARIVDALDRPAPAKCKKMARKRVLLQRLLRQQPLRPPGTRPPLGEISMGCNLSQALACDLTSEAPARPRPASLKAARSGPAEANEA